MDETDFLLQEILLLDSAGGAGDVKSPEQRLEEIKEKVEELIAYRTAKKTIIRDANGFAKSIKVEGFGAIGVNIGEDGLIESLSGAG